MAAIDLDSIVSRLARPAVAAGSRLIQADIYALLIAANIGLNDEAVKTESPVEGGVRIDVEIGQCVIEVKKNLTSTVLQKAEEQLAGYVQQRSAGGAGPLRRHPDRRRAMAARSPARGCPGAVSVHQLNKNAPDTGELLVWLEFGDVHPGRRSNHCPKRSNTASVPARPPISSTPLSCTPSTPPTPTTKTSNQRQLWAKLLRTALGAEFRGLPKNSSSTTPCWSPPPNDRRPWRSTSTSSHQPRTPTTK